MLNRLMLLLGHSCISVIGADMYIWLYYKRVCLFNTIQFYIVVEQKSVTPPTCISLQIHLNTCIVWRTTFPLQNDGWGRGGGYELVTSRLLSKNYFTCVHFFQFVQVDLYLATTYLVDITCRKGCVLSSDPFFTCFYAAK